MPERTVVVQPMGTADIMEEIWEEVAKHQTGRSFSREALEQAALSTLPIPKPAAAGMPLPLPALLQLDGAAFIHAAYATLLGRTPDEAGAAAIRAQLDRGCDRIEILGDLQRSREARAAGRRIAGLRRRDLARRAYRVRMVGPLVQFTAAALRRTGLSRRLAGRGEAMAALQAEFASRLAAVIAHADQVCHDMEKRSAAQQSTIESLTRRVATLQAAQEAAARRAAEERRRWAEHAAMFGLDPAAAEDGMIGAWIALSEEFRRHEDWHAATAETHPTGGMAELPLALATLRTQVEQRLTGIEALSLRRNQTTRPDAAPPAGADDRWLDSLYLAFTDRFRGTRADIKRRQRIYLPRLRAAGAGTPDRPVLDIGAGRGEFLELLAEARLVATGVDSNAAMVALCRRLDLACAQCDGLAYLQACQDGSLGAVASFHVIEHLPFEALVRLIDEALRTLAPGGLLVLETPNPANLLTASHLFYLDPTHRNPMPAALVTMILEARGFPAPEVLDLHPMQHRFPGEDRPLADALDKLFHGPQDYAVIAQKA